MDDLRVSSPSVPSRAYLIGIIIGFFVLTFVTFGQSLFQEFVRYDDGLLIYENPIVRSITPWTVYSAFTTYDPELYIPFTFLSYQIDYAIGGIDPFMYKLTNVILHTLNALLLLWFVYLLSGRKFVAVFTALLFAVHPLNTEAVVWASARKDVLATFFFLGSLVTYLLYADRSKRGFYYASVLLFLCALFSKIIAVALPVVLLLIDWQRDGKWQKEKLLEKAPYFGLSIIFGIIALFGKQSIVSESTFTQKLLMGCKSALFYLQKLFVPTDLSVLYPYRGEITLLSSDFLVPVAIVLMLLGLIFLFWKRYYWFSFSFLFFFTTLAPTCANFAKDGDYYIASDRYAYIPSIGIFFLVAMLASKLFAKWNPKIMSVLVAVVITLFAVLSFRQTTVWASTESLFTNVIRHYPESHRAQNNLGNVYRRAGKMNDAIRAFEAAIAIEPRPRSYSNLGAVYRKEGDMLQAIAQYRKALELDPESADAHFGLGIVYASRGDFTQARSEYEKAITIDPTYAEAYTNLGALYASQGLLDPAIENYQEALRVDPLFVQASYNLGVVLSKFGRNDEAITAYTQAIHIRPDFVAARINLGILLYNAGRIDEAIRQFRIVLTYDPENASAQSALQQMGVH